MRKRTKLVAVLSATALLAIGASMTSCAVQSGWGEEDGHMAASKLIENGNESGNTYYVDETGRMAANKWVELENENYYDKEIAKTVSTRRIIGQANCLGSIFKYLEYNVL